MVLLEALRHNKQYSITPKFQAYAHSARELRDCNSNNKNDDDDENNKYS
jgi:hypothetical protein